MARHIWTCDECGREMESGYEATCIDKLGKVFCSRSCAEKFVQDPANSETILGELDATEDLLDYDENWY